MAKVFCKPPSCAGSHFPRGLYQPEGCARFGLEALLLGAFVGKCTTATQILELGSGCGAALLALAFSNERINGVGLELAHELVLASRYNSLLLKIAARVQFIQCDVNDASSYAISGALRPFLQKFTGIMANPPWYDTHTGKKPEGQLKTQAYMGAGSDFFCAAASRLLTSGGKYYAIIPARLLGHFHKKAEATNLGLRQLLPIATKRNGGASRLLLICQKEAKDDLQWLPELRLRDQHNDYTEAALRLCPFLLKSDHNIPGYI